MNDRNRNKDIGLIGLGLVGTALISRFQQAGFAVVGYDINPAQCESAKSLGVRMVDSPSAILNHTNRIVLSLPDSSIVHDVIFGIQGLLNNLHHPLTIIDTTTGDPDETIITAKKTIEQSSDYIDACLIGSSVMIQDGNCVMVCGGSNTSIELNSDILDAIALKRFHVGEAGKGIQAKLVVNLILGLNRLVLSEGLVFAEQLGLDLPAILELLQSSAAYSKVMDHKGSKMIQKEFEPQARLKQHLKDVRIILSQSEKLGIQLPLSTLHETLLQKGVDCGLGELDNSAVIEVLRNIR